MDLQLSRQPKFFCSRKLFIILWLHYWYDFLYLVLESRLLQYCVTVAVGVWTANTYSKQVKVSRDVIFMNWHGRNCFFLKTWDDSFLFTCWSCHMRTIQCRKAHSALILFYVFLQTNQARTNGYVYVQLMDFLKWLLIIITAVVLQPVIVVTVIFFMSDRWYTHVNQMSDSLHQPFVAIETAN